MELNETQIDELISSYFKNFENLPYGVGVVKNDPFSTLVKANPSYYKLIGYTKKEFLEKYENRIIDILVDDVSNVLGQQCMEKDFDIEWDLRVHTADGSIRWVHDFSHYDAKLNLFFITVTDITDKMVVSTVDLSFEAFQVRNQILAHVSKYTTEHIIVADVITDEVVYMNISAMKMLKFESESDWLNKTYTEIIFGTQENIPADYEENCKKDFYIVEEFYNEFYKRYARTEVQTILIPNLNRKFRVNIITDITAQKQLDNSIAMQTTLNKCIEALFAVGVTDKEPKDAYNEILNHLKEYYQSDITFFYRFKDGTYEIENIYEVFEDGVEPSKHTFPITVPDNHIKVLQKLSNARTDEYNSILDTFDTNDKISLKELHSSHNVVDFSCVCVHNKEGQISACMGVTNPKSHGNDKELIHLLSRFICMFIEHEQDQNIKREAMSLEEIAKQTLVEKCMVNSQNLNRANESVTDTLNALCLHYDADFAVALLDQQDGYCITSYVGGNEVPNLDGLDNQPRHIMEKWVQVFAQYPEVVTDMDLVDPIAVMVKQLLKEKYGINNFIVSPMKDADGNIKGLLFVNNFKLMNRGHSMVHVVAESISSYLGKIGLYEKTQLGLLTRLANKTTVQNQISQLLEEGKNGALFVINIDDFKQLNDIFGHHMGDQAIVDLADSLKKIFKSSDIVGRVAGDEFMVFSPDLISCDDICSKANQILAQCYHRYEKDGHSHSISTSIGICVVDDKNKNFQPLKEKANYALYIAKKRGKHRYHIYTDAEYSSDNSMIDEMKFYPNVVEKLQSAIHDHSFVVHYQPIYHVPTQEYTQAEALVRIAKPDGTLIYPNDFIEIAENSGLAVEMTYQILEQVCRDFRELLINQPETTLTSVAINIPYLQFTDPEMENRFLDILKKYNIEPKQIKLEITERLVVTDMDLMMKRMDSLKNIGFEFELDDFGTDYSNLKMCVSLPLEIIKLDRSLLLAAMSSEKDRRFFQHILSGLHDSERHTIMEGVETQEQLDWTIGCGCEYIQGYYFSKPVNFEAFSKLLLNANKKIVSKTGFNPTDKLDKKVKEYVLDYYNLPYGVAVIQGNDCATLLRANPAFYKIIGYTKEQFQENHANSMNDILVDDFFNIVLQQTKSEDYDKEWDIRIQTANGEIRWIKDIAHYDAELDAFFVIFIDITDKMIVSTTQLSHQAFLTKHQILLHLSNYTNKYIVVSDIETDRIVYLSNSVMELYGFKQESDWKDKTYKEIGFGFEENVRLSYYEPLSEEKFTTHQYYNKFHKIYSNVQSKIITIPKLNKRMRLSIISDITAQKQLERKIEAQNSLHHCVEALFTAGATDKESKDAYYDILNEFKKYYRADRAFLYKFKDGTYEVENFEQVCEDGLKEIEIPVPMIATEQHIKQMKEFSKARLVNIEDVLNSLDTEHRTNLSEVYLEYKINTFACTTITNTKGEVVAFIGVTNPQSFEDTRTLMEILSRYICMFIEHEHDDALKEKESTLETISKKNLIEQSAKNLSNITYPKENISHTLDALCKHYEAEFAIIILRNEDDEFGITYVSTGNIPDLSLLQKSGHFMGSWLGTFQQYQQFASDIDFDDEQSPMIKKLLHDKLGINNFVASPMRDADGSLTGLLIVNNLTFINRSHLMVHVVSKDISDYLERVRMREKIQLEPTTKLSNKVATQNKISECLKHENKGALFIIDIDNFKKLNDTLGHQVGDEAIIDIAKILRSISRITDIVGCVGGDEFMIFCQGLISENSINTKAQQILENCCKVYKKDELSVGISVSIGVCCVNDICNTYDTLYEKADYALYRSKRDGKNRFTIY